MASDVDPLYAVLSPQQWRVWRIMCDGEEHTIDVLYKQARPLDKSQPSARTKQQIVGGLLARINTALKAEDCRSQAVPGATRRTYQLRFVPK